IASAGGTAVLAQTTVCSGGAPWQVRLRAPTEVRRESGYRLAPVAAIDVTELRVDREDHRVRVDLAHPDQACVGQVRPPWPVLDDHSLDGLQLVSEPEPDGDRAPTKQLEDHRRAVRDTAQEIDGFREHWLARPKGWAKAAHRFDGPRMVRVVRLQVSDDRTRVEQRRLHLPNPFK